MRYRSLRDCVLDLEAHGHLRRVTEEVDPHLEMAEIQRRAYLAEAPALLFENVKGCRFPAVSNLFGTMERCRLIFRSTIGRVQQIVQIKADPANALRSPFRYVRTPFTALCSLPRRARFRRPVLHRETSIQELPQIVSWPDDGGPFITLPQVYTEDPAAPGIMKSNVGMYRVQLGGNEYEPGGEIGLHYQIHRGIGPHHAAAVARGEPLRASIFVGGPPAHTLAAVMPLPEGLSELLFAGMLAGRRFRYSERDGYRISADADFCITGDIDPKRTLPEGPFGDHLGYYSLAHPFPVMRVHKVWHRKGAIWPFTVVGRPPQEDTSFGQLIHEITAPMVPKEVPGLQALHAVDAAGVHPLLLATANERYVPYADRRPQEILTVANAVLGFGQCSLAKYLFIASIEDDPDLDIHDIGAFLEHVLERIVLDRDLHFQTRTTIDTLDYTGTGLNEGSKLVVAAAGSPVRQLGRDPEALRSAWPDDFRDARLALPGVLVLRGPSYESPESTEGEIDRLSTSLSRADLDGFPVIVIVDDAEFAGRNLKNFLWVTFSRSNPSHDVYGIGSRFEHKHWIPGRSIVIDARRKPHHAPPLVEDPDITRRVDALSTPGKSLHGVI